MNIIITIFGALIGLAFIVLFMSTFRVSHNADEDLRKKGLID